jgi:mono/diheme cytochrome c family protein
VLIREAAVVAVLVLALAGCDERPSAPARSPRGTTRSVRITMDALHRAGGVPPRWRFTPPPGDPDAGRRAFADLGCHACHAVAGESLSTPTAVGPELTGMGTHHPPEYFAEAILNPDAVLIEGPGYIDAQGRSTMPVYPHMTLAELADLVAYLTGLTEGGRHFAHGSGAIDHRAMGHLTSELPAAPPGAASSFWVQIYDVKDGKLGEFEDWFRREGAARFLAYDGVVGLETYVDLTREGPALVSLLGFRDDAARARFLDDPATEALGLAFDEFIGPPPPRSVSRPPLYRAPTLSATRDHVAGRDG